MIEHDGFTTVAELVALDPASAGTKHPDNPLAAADLIIAHFPDGSESIIYGLARLNEISQVADSRVAVSVIRVQMGAGDDELETLCAMVAVLRGHHDYYDYGSAAIQ